MDPGRSRLLCQATKQQLDLSLLGRIACQIRVLVQHDDDPGQLAVDFQPAPIRVFQANFPAAKALVAPVESVIDGELGAPLTRTERATRRSVGPLQLLVGGPPCQGHSNLNNRTRRADPKNRFYLRMARAAEVLQPAAMIVENVPAVIHDSENVVMQAAERMRDVGYTVTDSVVELLQLGVPQRRRRHVLLAVRSKAANPSDLLATALAAGRSKKHDLRWAIRDLERSSSSSWVDTPSRPSPDNLARMTWLLQHDRYDLPNALRPRCHQGEHSYVSMYGRLRWDQPAQTVTSGFGSMGQGRFMHPALPRTLTPHEAARIQGFPDYFVFDGARSRTELSVIIGNAVPPALTRTLVSQLLASRTLETNH